MNKMSAQAEKKIRREKFKLEGRPEWMSQELWAACERAFRAKLAQEASARARRGEVGRKHKGLKLEFRLAGGEMQAMRHNPPMPISQWAEKYRVVENSSIKGPWKNTFTHYLIGVMDAAGLPGVETVILCKSPQTGGSESGHNIVGYCIDRCPGPVLYVFPDELTARENAKDRIIPMITATPRLNAYLTGNDDDTSSLRVKLAHMVIYLGWSGSVARLGNKPIRVLILDELDKYSNPKNEASSESLAEKRCTTWKERKKIFKISTPTTEDGPIWRAYSEEANARFLYWVKCPHCGKMQVMQFERLMWPGKDTENEMPGEQVFAEKRAHYPCEECGACWTDADRDKAVRQGEWREERTGQDMYAYIAEMKPVKVGFHLPALNSYFVSMSEVARAYLRWKETGSMAALKDFNNQYLALPWKEQFEERNEDELGRLCDDRPSGMVPGPLPETPGEPRVSTLLMTVDTQKNWFRYVIRAWGFGRSKPSWLIRAGSVEHFEDLDEILASRFADAQGNEYAVSKCMIDAMGTRTAAVYAWAAQHKSVVMPWQGVQKLSTPYVMTPREYYPGANGKKIAIEGGLILWRCDTTFYKSMLAEKLMINPGDPGAFMLHSNEDKGLNQYFKEMCAEVYSDEAMGWINPHGRANHWWDCEVMQMALSDILHLENALPPEKAQDAPTQRRMVAMRSNRRYGR